MTLRVSMMGFWLRIHLSLGAFDHFIFKISLCAFSGIFVAKYFSFSLGWHLATRGFTRKSVAFVSDSLCILRVMRRFVRIQFKQLTLVFGVLALCAFGGCQRMSDTDGDTVLVFAAVSLSDSLSEVGGAFREETGTDVTFNFAGSQTLAQQIAASGRGDLFISADEEWMDFIAAKEHLEAGSRISLLSNRLVLVSAAAAEFRVDRLEDLCSLDFEFLCIGDPDAVPAGRYARKWFEQERCGDGETLWEGLRSRISPAPDVRAALEQVLSRSDSIGVVYRTDFLRARERTKLLLESPLQDIRYPAALLKGRENVSGGAAFYEFLKSEKVMAIFERHGFGRVE
jgi:molybdate transport system substrate-binding protein